MREQGHVCRRGPCPSPGIRVHAAFGHAPERRDWMEYPLIGVLIEALKSLLQGLLDLLG